MQNRIKMGGILMETIVFIIPSLTNGGAERSVVNIANGLSKKYKIVILCFYYSLHKYFLNDNVEVVYLFNDNDNNIFKKSKKIRNKIKDINPKIIVPFLTYVCIYTTMSLLFTRFLKKICCTVRINPKHTKNINLYKFCIRITGNLLVQNEGEKNFFSKKIQRKTIVIPNSVSNDVFDYEKKYNSKLESICCVGRLCYQKNFEEIIKVMSKIDCKIKLYIYGQGEYEEKLKDLVNQLNLSSQVIFKGYSKNILADILNHDLFILTSRFEGMPNALMEAMGIGLPVISNNCEYGPSDLIKNNFTGLLYDYNDNEKLKLMIDSLISNYDLAIKMGENARKEILSLYNEKSIILLWEQFIERNIKNEL